MDYQIIKSQFGGDMLYVPTEKMLYVLKRDANEVCSYICYQTVLTDKKKKNHSSHIKCNARVRLLTNGKCERMNVHITHTAHPDHQILSADKMKTRNMKEKCEYLKINFAEDAHKMPNRRIFQREIVK